MTFWLIIAALFAAGAGAAAGFFLPSSTGVSLANQEKQLEEAKNEAEAIKREAQEKIKQSKETFEEEEKSLEDSLEKLKEMISQKEDIVKRREDRNSGYERNVRDLRKQISGLQNQREETVKEAIEKLSKISNLDKEKALAEARKNLEHLTTDGKEMRESRELEELEEDVMRHAKAVLQVVVQRLGVQSSVDRNSTSINVKNDKFKGLLVGKDAVNIKYLESLLPVSVIFNFGDSKTIHVGGVNLFRRNIAVRTIQKLQNITRRRKSIDHRLIKNLLEESEKEIMAECDRKGAWALKQVEIDPKSVPEEMVNYMGRLYFRTSYGQNILHHSLETAFAAKLIAEMIGADSEIAMQAALYHDIGKAIDHDVGGAHDDLSKEILEKHNFDPRIVHAAFAHHDKVPCEMPEDFIVKAADAISGGRPGARQESVTNYFERMQELEAVANSFGGVSKVFTMSAGREVRVIVNKDQIGDGDMGGMAKNIAEKIAEDVSFPGIIKINLIRTTKSVDYARDLTKSHDR